MIEYTPADAIVSLLAKVTALALAMWVIVKIARDMGGDEEDE